MDTGILLIAALGLLVVMMFLRSSRQQRDFRRTQQALVVGATVATGSGMIGTVVDVTDDVVTLESEAGSRTRWYRAAVARVLDSPETHSAEADSSGGDSVAADAAEAGSGGAGSVATDAPEASVADTADAPATGDGGGAGKDSRGTS